MVGLVSVCAVVAVALERGQHTEQRQFGFGHVVWGRVSEGVFVGETDVAGPLRARGRPCCVRGPLWVPKTRSCPTPGSSPPAELLGSEPHDAPDAVQHQPPDDSLLDGGYHPGRGKPRGDDPDDDEPADHDRNRAPLAVCRAATIRAAHESSP